MLKPGISRLPGIPLGEMTVLFLFGLASVIYKAVTFLMRDLLLVLSLLICSCSPSGKDSNETSSESASSTLAQLEGEWQRLTDWGNGQQVIFRPCDADNLMMQINSDTLMIGWGQDATTAIIRSFYTDEDGRVILTVTDLDEDARKVYAFQFEDAAGKLARWWLYGNDEESELFAHEDLLEQYNTYEQPCSECWDDCDDE
jgi:hypothetical protein